MTERRRADRTKSKCDLLACKMTASGEIDFDVLHRGVKKPVRRAGPCSSMIARRHARTPGHAKIGEGGKRKMGLLRSRNARALRSGASEKADRSWGVLHGLTAVPLLIRAWTRILRGFLKLLKATSDHDQLGYSKGNS